MQKEPYNEDFLIFEDDISIGNFLARKIEENERKGIIIIGKGNHAEITKLGITHADIVMFHSEKRKEEEELKYKIENLRIIENEKIYLEKRKKGPEYLKFNKKGKRDNFKAL